MKFPGFMVLYDVIKESDDEEDENPQGLPELSEGEVLDAEKSLPYSTLPSLRQDLPRVLS